MTAQAVLTDLAKANLAMTAAILIVIAVRKLVRRGVGPGLTYALWLLPLAATVAVFLPARQTPPVRIVASPIVPDLVHASPAALVSPDAGARAWAMLTDPWLLAAGLWLVGAAAMLAWLLLKQAQFLRHVRQGHGGPAVVGVFRSRIVTPADFYQRFTRRERAVVLAHERVHLARQDARLNTLAALLRCLCWFNPLVHIAAHLMRIDQELACDAAVVAGRPQARRAYAQALLKAELAHRPLPLGCYWPAGTEHPLMERIAMLNLNGPSALRRRTGITALMLVCLGGAAAAWAAQPPRFRTVIEPARHPSPNLLSLAQRAATGAPLAAAAPDRPDQGPALSRAAPVCVTNACMARSPAVTDAVARGDAAAVLAAGGTYQDAVAAIAKLTEGAVGRPRLPAFLAMFQDTSDGSTIRQTDVQGRPGLIRTSPDGGMMTLSLDGAFAIVTGGAVMSAFNALPSEGQTYQSPFPAGPVDILRAQLTANGDTEGLEILNRGGGMIGITPGPDGTATAVRVIAPDGRSRSTALPPGTPFSNIQPPVPWQTPSPPAQPSR